MGNFSFFNIYKRQGDLGRIEDGDENREYNSHPQPYVVS